MVKSVGRSISRLWLLVLASLITTTDAPPPPKWIVYVGTNAERDDAPYQRMVLAFAGLESSAASRMRLRHHRISLGDDERTKREVSDAFALAPAVLIAPTGATMKAAAPFASDRTAVVFAARIDPLAAGVVESMRSSGRPMTGVSSADVLDEKRVELLLDAFPGVKRIAVLTDRYWPQGLDGSTFPTIEKRMGLKIVIHYADNVTELDALMQQPCISSFDAWYVPYTYIAYLDQPRVISHLNRLRRPAIFASPKAVNSGASLSYWQETDNIEKRVASLAWRIVQGEDPATIPIERPKRFVLEVRGHVNAAGLRVDASVVRRADVVR